MDRVYWCTAQASCYRSRGMALGIEAMELGSEVPVAFVFSFVDFSHSCTGVK
jgi:hypothetical protein